MNVNAVISYSLMLDIELNIGEAQRPIAIVRVIGMCSNITKFEGACGLIEE